MSNSTALTVFEFPVSSKKQSPVRVIDIQGISYFIAKDVANILAYQNTAEAVGKHCKYAKSLAMLDIASGHSLQPSTNLIPESDVLRLILKSHQSGSHVEKFKDWFIKTFQIKLTAIQENFCRNPPPTITSLYVVLFSHEIIKVGKAVNPLKRLASYYRQAKLFKRKVLATYIADKPGISEEMLINFCHKHGKIYQSNEYFQDLDFITVVKYLKKTSKDIQYSSAKKFFTDKEIQLYPTFLKKLHSYCLKHQIKINFIHKDGKKIKTYPLLILKEVWKLV